MTDAGWASEKPKEAGLLVVEQRAQGGAT